MQLDRLRQRSWVVPTLAVALLTTPIAGAPTSRTPRATASFAHGAAGGGQLPLVCPQVVPPATWSTQLLGTPSVDYGLAVAVDIGICAIFVGGETIGSLAGAAGGYDGYLARYSTAGALVWVRQFGSSSNDVVNGTATDSQHNVYVTGSTDGTMPGSPTLNPGGADAFLAKYDQDGNLL